MRGVDTDVSSLAAGVLERAPRAIARALSLVSDDPPSAAALMAALHPHTGRAVLVGVTGAPGAGKSTLVDRLISAFRSEGRTVGVVAVDPTSPFTGGAILGDRVRMQAHAADPGVFIRSLATRGQIGGLARATADAAAILDAAGFDVVLVETVGVGQDEVDIAALADVCIVVLVPDAGDDVQSLKAGIMEIADIFAVNKCDRTGADRTVASVEAALGLGPTPDDGWVPPVIRTIATDGAGVGDLVSAIARFRAAAGGRVAARRGLRAESRIEQIARAVLSDRLHAAGLAAYVAQVRTRQMDPHRAAAELIGRVLGPAPAGLTGAVLDHVGVAVRDAGPLLTFLERAFGVTADPPEEVPAQGVRVRFVRLGVAAVELIEVLDPSSPVAAFLARRGPGLHHLAVRVVDLGGTLASLQAAGVRLVDHVPRAGAHGTAVAFVHPSAAGGVLVELVAGGRN